MDENDCISRYFQQDSQVIIPCQGPVLSSNTHNTLQDLSQSSMEDEDMLSLSQLTIEEQESIKIDSFFNITPRMMPTSPHYVVEENFRANPWAMLVATIFLNKTSYKIARRYIKTFFEEYPSPYHVLSVSPTSLERFFLNLGLKKRGQMIWRFSYQFVSSKWYRASDLYGIGKYGEDAYRIFCLGHTDLDPNDRYLKLYLDWLTCHTEFLEENGAIDSELVIEDPVLKYYRLTLRNVEN